MKRLIPITLLLTRPRAVALVLAAGAALSPTLAPACVITSTDPRAPRCDSVITREDSFRAREARRRLDRIDRELEERLSAVPAIDTEDAFDGHEP